MTALTALLLLAVCLSSVLGAPAPMNYSPRTKFRIRVRSPGQVDVREPQTARAGGSRSYDDLLPEHPTLNIPSGSRTSRLPPTRQISDEAGSRHAMYASGFHGGESSSHYGLTTGTHTDVDSQYGQMDAGSVASYGDPPDLLSQWRQDPHAASSSTGASRNATQDFMGHEREGYHHYSTTNEHGEVHHTYRRRRRQAVVLPPHPTAPPDETLARLVWKSRNYERRMTLLEIVSKRRGIRYEVARTCLRDALTRGQELSMISKDPARIDEALHELFPVTEDTVLPVWMNMMSEAQADTFVHRLVAITNQRPDVVRNYFLKANLQPDVALSYVDADDESLAKLAKIMNFLPMDSVRDKHGNWTTYDELPEYPWQYQLDSMQRTRVVNLVMKAFHTDKEEAIKILGRSHVGLGFGASFLDYDDSTYNDFIRYLCQS
ncbi:hypothetical protein CBS101457_000108 [Exobasidium rhododendri]|nr:hypothetical protein CBS101457_000108 [Exobasidium rhododendri]